MKEQYETYIDEEDICMKLNSYCVYNFRSVEDSGWIECSDTTTLVRVNESGKTNILKALKKVQRC